MYDSIISHQSGSCDSKERPPHPDESPRDPAVVPAGHHCGGPLYMYVYIYIYNTYVDIYTYVYIYACVYIYIYIYICTHTHICTHMCIYRHMCYIYIYIHTYKAGLRNDAQQARQQGHEGFHLDEVVALWSHSCLIDVI